MAPAALMSDSNEEVVSGSQKRKLRKPIMEKIRRDRINTSIDKLKILLQQHLKDQKLNVKLEKADILEMTVNFLKEKSTWCANPGYTEGCAHCLQDTDSSSHVLRNVRDPQAIGSFTMNQNTAVKRTTAPKHTLKSVDVSKESSEQSKGTPWRPW